MRNSMRAPWVIFGVGWLIAWGLCGLPSGSSAQLPKEKPDAGVEIQKWIKDLESGDFARRDEAYKQLLKTPAAVGELRLSLKTPGLSSEAKRRVENLLDELDVEKLLEKLEGDQDRIDAAYATLTKFGLNHTDYLLNYYKST